MGTLCYIESWPSKIKHWSLADSANLWPIPFNSSEIRGIGQNLEESAKESLGIGQIEIRTFSCLSGIVKSLESDIE
jgi:hypothetical protein